MKQTNKSDRFRRYLNRALLVFWVLLLALVIRACNQPRPRRHGATRAGNARNMGNRPDSRNRFRTCIRGGRAMKTIMDKLANQLNNKEKAIVAVDVVSTILLIVNDGASQKEAIHTVSVIAREAMDRFEEVGK
ncbi:hypothetical protein CYJ98_004980 [Neisseria perflava]|uniref:Uncharacterized protein n=1 Tax=Neisseria perflava TaxID=33053 RepID=A0AAF0YUP5_NEIPE|nr:hypothetical protein [Neisseria perflava]WOS99016.1 hypothetical protein CYJ98_004980 [Neisseria perflava]